jgi:hypothetical protein
MHASPCVRARQHECAADIRYLVIAAHTSSAFVWSWTVAAKVLTVNQVRRVPPVQPTLIARRRGRNHPREPSRPQIVRPARSAFTSRVGGFVATEQVRARFAVFLDASVGPPVRTSSSRCTQPTRYAQCPTGWGATPRGPEPHLGRNAVPLSAAPAPVRRGGRRCQGGLDHGFCGYFSGGAAQDPPAPRPRPRPSRRGRYGRPRPVVTGYRCAWQEPVRMGGPDGARKMVPESCRCFLLRELLPRWPGRFRPDGGRRRHTITPP